MKTMLVRCSGCGATLEVEIAVAIQAERVLCETCYEWELYEQDSQGRSETRAEQGAEAWSLRDIHEENLERQGED